MLLGHHWADPGATRRSLELVARHVMPEFQGAHPALLPLLESGSSLGTSSTVR